MRKISPSQLYFSKFAIFIMLFILLFPLSIRADGGWIPPPDVDIWEPDQRAVVAWNGSRELLILIINAYVSSDSKVLRIIPLPSNPISIEKGDLQIFIALNSVIFDYVESIQTITTTKFGATVVQHKVIGSHNITVIEAHSTDDFLSWTEQYLIANELDFSISSPRVEEIIAKYIGNGINYYVFDLVDLSLVPQNIEPIVYEFESDPLLSFGDLIACARSCDH